LANLARRLFGARYVDVAPRLDAIEVRLDRLELNVEAARQQLDECIAFLRVQHEVTRDVLKHFES
jgi:hypothetical protein